MHLNIFEIIKAAKTKPFGFQAFYPGPGIGGHCIPVDPIYLSWLAKSKGVKTDFINLAANTEKLIFSNSEYGKSYLYLKNMGSENIDIQATGGSTIYASLAELEFAFIPWNGTLDLYAESSANNIVEVGIFEV